jgi:hypothetical protein
MLALHRNMTEEIMKHSVYALFIVAAILLSSCQTTKEYLSTFHGKERSYILGRLGPPDIKEPIDKGGEIWIYQERSISIIPAKVETSYEKDTSSDSDIKKEKKFKPLVRRIYITNQSFYINKDGIIYDTACGSRMTEE